MMQTTAQKKNNAATDYKKNEKAFTNTNLLLESTKQLIEGDYLKIEHTHNSWVTRHNNKIIYRKAIGH